MANEVRLIDANAFAEALENADADVCETYHDCYCDWGFSRKVIEGIVDSIPTVDAVPVVHGRWECTYDEATGETDVTCSRCKSTRTINGCYVTTKGESCYFEDNYCPNCGADMRERSEGE